MNTKIRIKDIAKLAGVSEGTVDRVMHKRGEVSAKSKEAVERVLKEINYTPNILARSLASKKQFVFSYLIPEYVKGDYWSAIVDGFEKAAKEFEQYNVIVKAYYYNQFNVTSFNAICSQIIDDLPDALVIAPIFKNETIVFANTLLSLKTPFCFIDSLIQEVDYTSYYGQNSFMSGYVGGRLLLSELDINAKILLIRTNRQGSVSNQTLLRIDGFQKYINDNKFIGLQILNIEFKEDDNEDNLRKVEEIFRENTDIQAAITFNSKVYRLASILTNLNLKDIKVLGYDLLNENVEYLKKGVVSYLISQSPKTQSYLIISDLCKKIIFNQDIKKNNFVPIDVLIKENIEDYLSFHE